MRSVPIFLDRHDAPGITAEAAAEAHLADLAVQDKYGVHYHTYWIDPTKGCVFCLAEGPDQAAVEAVHREAHGAVAAVIMEIPDFTPLNEYFGGLPSHPPGTPYAAPAMRAIVFTDVCGSVAQTYELGDEGHMQLLREHDRIVRAELAANDGQEVKHTGDGIMASFHSVASAVGCSIAIQRALAVRNERETHPVHISVGISVGEPVTDGERDLFGAAVQLAARLCDAAEPGDIAVSIAVKELCAGKTFKFDDRGHMSLKGLPEPTQVFTVGWHA